MCIFINVSKADKLIKKPISDTEIKRILGKSTKLLTYPDLAKYSDLNQLLPAPNDFVVILIVEDETQDVISGHWTALLKYDNLFEFFDPYGNPPDYDLKKWMTKEQRAKLREDKPYLSYLLQNQRHIYNKVKYEKMKKGVNSCGHHTCLRCYEFAKKGKGLPEYQKYLENLRKLYGVSYDEIAASFVSKFVS